MIQVGLASCWRNVSARDSLTKTRNTEHSFTARRPPSCLQSRHFRFYPPLPSQVFLVGWQFLFFINRKIKKRFSFWISPALILFPAVSLLMKLFCQVWIFNKLEFREKEIKNTILTSVPGKNLKLEDDRLVFLFLKNKK